MKIWGKVFGALFGFMFGRFVGAALGFYLGHKFDQRLADDFDAQGGFSRFFGGNEGFSRQAVFFHATFAVMGHIAKASGQVTQADIRSASRMMAQMGLGAEARREAQQAFNEGKQADFPLQQTLREFKRSALGRREILRVFLEIQLQAAFADGQLHQREQQILDVVAKTLGFSGADLEQLLQQLKAETRYHQQSQQQNQQQSHQRKHRSAPPRGPSLANAYGMLGVQSSDSDAVIKRAYRKQMSQHHPDKLVAKGLPPEMMELAKQKAQDIQAAYEQIKIKRGMR